MLSSPRRTDYPRAMSPKPSAVDIAAPSGDDSSHPANKFKLLARRPERGVFFFVDDDDGARPPPRLIQRLLPRAKTKSTIMVFSVSTTPLRCFCGRTDYP